MSLAKKHAVMLRKFSIDPAKMIFQVVTYLARHPTKGAEKKSQNMF